MRITAIYMPNINATHERPLNLLLFKKVKDYEKLSCRTDRVFTEQNKENRGLFCYIYVTQSRYYDGDSINFRDTILNDRDNSGYVIPLHFLRVARIILVTHYVILNTEHLSISV